jgi:NTP pyrophosphatase (non-canonical NTP hydrolase)
MDDLDQFIDLTQRHGEVLYNVMRDWQAACEATAVYPGMGTLPGLMYCALGLAGEGGEVAEEVKRAYRNQESVDDGLVTDKRSEKIEDELGDVLWYVAQICNELDLRMDQVMLRVANKLRDRRERHALASGDPGGGAARVEDGLTHD